jgi:hypothetical protein
VLAPGSYASHFFNRFGGIRLVRLAQQIKAHLGQPHTARATRFHMFAYPFLFTTPRLIAHNLLATGRGLIPLDFHHATSLPV